MKKKLITAGIAAAFAIAGIVVYVTTSSAAPGGHINCSQVRCAGCPDGYHFAPTPSNCCRCLPN